MSLLRPLSSLTLPSLSARVSKTPLSPAYEVSNLLSPEECGRIMSSSLLAIDSPSWLPLSSTFRSTFNLVEAHSNRTQSHMEKALRSSPVEWALQHRFGDENYIAASLNLSRMDSNIAVEISRLIYSRIAPDLPHRISPKGFPITNSSSPSGSIRDGSSHSIRAGFRDDGTTAMRIMGASRDDREELVLVTPLPGKMQIYLFCCTSLRDVLDPGLRRIIVDDPEMVPLLPPIEQSLFSPSEIQQKVMSSRPLPFQFHRDNPLIHAQISNLSSSQRLRGGIELTLVVPLVIDDSQSSSFTLALSRSLDFIASDSSSKSFRPPSPIGSDTVFRFSPNSSVAGSSTAEKEWSIGDGILYRGDRISHRFTPPLERGNWVMFLHMPVEYVPRVRSPSVLGE